ncbi:DUF4249 family protein [Allomuricauda sp. SCSIO 65647]|uniref:DUF4249 family protein n=1 Tax=Allomuricauda sp. SCSIO 65647 TaxID=2908843 RepID=UPI001F32007B|nr:DUF4249 family protein [Muricauda sp. SCSIO 65647]UJH67633.1 DUF4249 domain-containing protein [Muricauda sp. SCSIO 65647]
MALKKHILRFIPLLVFFSCEDVIDVDLATVEPKLVIDALVGYNVNNGDPITIGQVRLTLTTDFFAEEVPPAENASVQIIDEETGDVYPLTENEPGIFRDGFPDLEFGRDYTLVVIYQGQTYRATEQLQPTGQIENVEQGDGFLFDEDEETEVIVTFVDIPDQRNYYLFAFGFDNYLVTDDEFYQDQSLTFSYFYEDIEPGDLLTITLLGIDKEFASYVDQALVQAGEDGGGFGVPPATVRGNVLNNTEPDNFPFGYFAISEVDVELFTVQ